MQNSSGNNINDRFPSLRRASQITDSHCGPAVLQMLLSHIGVEVSQENLTNSIGALDFIYERGIRPDELALIISKMAPTAQFWYKQRTKVSELEEIINVHNYPVGVEWQNLFYNTVQEEIDDTGGEEYDFGHYSIIKDINIKEDEIVMVDPYKDFSQQDRKFSLSWFESRWWDYNDVNIGGYIRPIKDERLSFVITLKGVSFPKQLEYLPL